MNSHHRFPWRDGNRYQLLVDGEHFFPAMLDAIRKASSHVLLEFYLFESGVIAERFIAALLEARTRGVQVYLLLDDFGAMKLVRHDRQRLVESGVQLSFYNPLHYGQLRRNLFRDHRKLLLADGTIAFIGGAGITDQFATLPEQSPPWHETMVRISGPCVADWQEVFEQNWNNWASPVVALPAPHPHPQPGGTPGRVTLNSPSRMEIKRSLLKRIRTAEQRIWISTAYFIPSFKLRRALRHAVVNGADVRLLLPGEHTDHPAVRHASRRYYNYLLNHGIRIYEYQPRFLHAKIILCDGWVSTGSSNIDRWNLRWNLEANQEIDDENFSRQIEELFLADFLQSKEILPQEWQRRTWPHLLREWFWGKIELWLERFGHFSDRFKG
ncbi:MAG TPA: phospholipase D-like domain-containing protein [Gammaproteobacteria bacterium]